jgi:hypothetical protein
MKGKECAFQPPSGDEHISLLVLSLFVNLTSFDLNIMPDHDGDILRSLIPCWVS